MTAARKILSSALAAVTLAGALATTAAPAQARGGAVAAGIIGGIALGAMAAHAAEPRRVYVVERRYVRKHRCGCVHHVHHHVVRY